MTLTAGAPQTKDVQVAGQRVTDVALERDVERFLFEEAQLLDTHDYGGWLKLFAADARYRVPLRYNRTVRDAAQDQSTDRQLAHFDDDFDGLRARVVRLGTGMAWAEDPPSRTRHLVTNVLVSTAPAPAEYAVASNFLVWRSRGSVESDIFAGRRDDVLRRSGDSFLIARRVVLLDQATVLAKNISVFF